MEKYFRMVTHIEHDWGTYLASAWSFGPTLLVYLSDGFWMACAIFYKEDPQANHEVPNQEFADRHPLFYIRKKMCTSGNRTTLRYA
jgi:hypothetical protein